MALETLFEYLTEEEYLSQRFAQNHGTGVATLTPLSNFKAFCKDTFKVDVTEIINELRLIQDNVTQTNKCLVILQKFISWLSVDHPHILMERKDNLSPRPCRAKDPESIKIYVGQIRLYLRKVGGVRLTSEDITDFVSYPAPLEKDEVEPMLLSDFKKIVKRATPKRALMYRIKKDCEARIGAMVQLRKKNFNTEVRPIEVTFPKHIMKKKHGISFTNVKYVIQEDEEDLIDHLATIPDSESLVFGVNEIPFKAVAAEEVYWSRLITNMGFDEKYSNGRMKKNIHSIKALTFTAAEEAVNETYANAYGDHSRYTKNYLRWTKEKKIEKFRKLEPLISIYTEYERVTDETLIKENNTLKATLAIHDEILGKLVEDKKLTTRKTPKEDLKKLMTEILRENNLL